MTLMSLADVKARFSEVVGRVSDHHERVVVTVHGKPSAVLLSMYDYESITETLEAMSEPGLVESLEAERNGPTYTLDEVAAQMRAVGRLPGEARQDVA